MPAMTCWALVSGPRGAERSDLARRVAAGLAAAGLRVAGFVQRSTHEGRDVRDIVLERVGRADAVALALAGRTARAGEEEFCSLAFDLAGFAQARGWLEADAPGADVLVLDDVARLEAAGRGHHDAVRAALAASDARPVVLSVRADQLLAVLDRFRLPDPVAALECAADNDAVAAFVRQVKAAAAPAPRPHAPAHA
jgi:nucleoside-triphosphatase THEP1